MNELHLPFAVYEKQGENYLLNEVYIHKVKINVRQKMPNKEQTQYDNDKLCCNINSCWIAVFVEKERCFSLTGNHHQENTPVWLYKNQVMRFNPVTTRKTTDYITNSVDLVIPLSSRLDCYCPFNHGLISSTLLFSNYMTYPMRIPEENFHSYLVVFTEHWKKVMKETIGKNKIFCLPVKLAMLDEKKLTEDTKIIMDLRHNKQSVSKSENNLDLIIKNIKDDQSHQYSKIKHSKRPRCVW